MARKTTYLNQEDRNPAAVHALVLAKIMDDAISRGRREMLNMRTRSAMRSIGNAVRMLAAGHPETARAYASSTQGRHVNRSCDPE